MIVSIVAAKGGVGKTTSAVNLAGALARWGHRVLLVDLDGQASASLSLGFQRSELAPSAADVLLRGMPARDAIRPSRTANLWVLTASADLLSAEMELSALPRKETRLADALAPAKGPFAFVFVDCPPGLGLLARNALLAADTYLVPAVPQYLAVEGLQNLQLAAQRFGLRADRRLPLLGILPTMVDYRTKATTENMTRIRERFARDVFAVEIRVNTTLAEAPEQGLTIFEHDASATGARAYELAAEELLLRVQEKNLDRRAEGQPDVV